ncbi:Folylpolyglutamate synthase [bacterium HR26]|nr:Folylpolyglutamate synthase [bacterium HR26]
MDYLEALRYLSERSGYDRGFVANPFEREGIGLERTAWVLRALGNPERRYPSVHIAGTKGKGSTAACLASILGAAGYRVGLYTSPHLHTFRERIQIAGRPIDPELFAELTAELAAANTALVAERPDWGEATAFELATALALLAFARAEVDVAVVEVGLGGRLDATNVLLPEVAAITSISYDHTQILGNTLAEIAGEKAGIIKPGRPVVSAPQRPEAEAVIARAAAERGVPLLLGGRDWVVEGAPARFSYRGPGGELRNLRLALRGAHQVENAGVALAVVQLLRERGLSIPEPAVRRGLAEVQWPGRLEVLRERPLVIADGAHNVDSAERLAQALRAEFAWRRFILILGIARDKDIPGIVRALAPLANQVVAVASHSPRAARPERILSAASELQPPVPAQEAGSVAAALATALGHAGPEDLILVTGSLYAVAEAREALGLAQADPQERALLFG